MNSTLEETGANQVKLTISLSAVEVKEYFDQVIQQVAPQVKIAGFRPGKAPRKVIEQHVGQEYVTQQALERAVTHSYYKAVKQHDLKPIGQPQTDLAGEMKDPELSGLEYTAEVAVLPEVTLGEYGKLKVKPAQSSFAPEQVKETFEQLRKSRATYQAVERPAANGDRVEIDFEGTRKGQPVEGAKSENHPLTLGENTFVPGFEDNLVGLKVGDTKKFKVKFPKDYHAADLANEKVEFTVTVKQVEAQQLPAADDAFATQFGAKSIADLRNRLEANLKQEKQQEADRLTEQEVIEVVVKQVKVELPALLIDQELDRMIAEYREELSRQGVTFEQYLEHLKKTEDDLRKDQRDQAADRLKMSLVLNTVQEAEQIVATDAEIDHEQQHQLEQAQDPEQVERMQGDEFRDYLRRVIGNRKTVAHLVTQLTKE